VGVVFSGLLQAEPEPALALAFNLMRLDHYTLGTYTPGAPRWKQVFWYFFVPVGLGGEGQQTTVQMLKAEQY